MKLIDNMVEKLNIAAHWKDSSNVTWFATGNLDLRELAVFLTESGARLVTITATQLPRDEGWCLDYLWDRNGELLGFAFYLSGNAIPSIYDITEAADWIEREIHEEYAIEFTGRAYQPLLLREGEPIGVNLREEGK